MKPRGSIERFLSIGLGTLWFLCWLLGGSVVLFVLIERYAGIVAPLVAVYVLVWLVVFFLVRYYGSRALVWLLLAVGILNGRVPISWYKYSKSREFFETVGNGRI